jgi:hypothetical protein
LFPCKCVTFFQQGSAFKAKYRWCLEKGLDSIVVKLSFEEVHVQSGHVLFRKAFMNSMKGCRTLFRKCRICSWKLHSCLFNIKYIFFEKHKLLWKNK